jgi:hypothetical protein
MRDEVSFLVRVGEHREGHRHGMFKVQGRRDVPHSAGGIPAQAGLPFVWLLPLEMPEMRDNWNEKASQREGEGAWGIRAAVSFRSACQAANPVRRIAREPEQLRRK